MTAGGDAKADDLGFAVVDKFGVGFVKEVVNPEREADVLARTIGEAQ